MVTTSKVATGIINTDLGIVDDVIRAALDTQPWYRKYANTVTTVLFTATNAAWLLVSTGIDLPEPVVIGIAVTVMAANILGVHKTKNGVTDSTADVLKSNLETYLGKHRA